MGKANGVGVGVGVDADVSAVGALVWVRRPNGSWWPGRVASRLELPDGCPAPPRSPATPILLLGRRDGPAFVEWCNLERSKRVKPFRCGEADLDDLIRRAEEQAARRRRASAARNARKEDAVLQALDIERARLRLRPRAPPPTASCPPPPPPPRKRKTPNDSEDDAPAARRMRDLTDIGSPPKPTTGQMTRSRQAHHDATAAAAAKRSKVPPTVDQVDNNLPCGALRKKDRSRPLSELCNGVKPSNGLDTSLDKFKPEQPKGVNGTSCVPRPLDDAFARGPVDQPVDAPIAAAMTILKADHLHAHQPCAPTKAPPTWECTKRASNCSKDGMSSQCDSRNPKKKTTSSAGHEGGGRTRKGRTAKQKAAPINEVILLKRRTAKSAATPDEDDKSLVVMLPDALVHAALRQRSEIKCEPEEPSGTIGRHHSNGETGSVPPVVSEPAPPQRRDLRCHVAVKPTKTLQLNPSLYDVEISSGPGCGGGSKGRHVPLVSLMSRSSRRPVVGYPVSVEVLDAACCHPPAPSVDGVPDAARRHPPAPSVDGVRDAVRCHPPAPSVTGVLDATCRHPPARSIDGVPDAARRHPPAPSVGRVRDAVRRHPPAPGVGGVDHPPSTSSGAHRLVKVKEEVEEEAPQRAVPASAQRARAKRSRRKASEDELWRPHSKEEETAAPRPVRARRSVRRKAGSEDESWRPHSKKPAVAASAAVSSPRKMRRLSSLGATSQRGGGDEERRRRRRKGPGAGTGQLVVACVPVRVVFSRIKEALVSQPLKLKSK
uniref:PWWP1 n=1 Tax=Triticum monococcum subsp. monococcum TaxID=408188 RepID=A0A140D7V9_TRIMO|nr:PWWP1 [Triticum monococcum subsp. monococcum]AMK08983.1 PWWP1 [Triticum monococcum subsp. monococcum]